MSRANKLTILSAALLIAGNLSAAIIEIEELALFAHSDSWAESVADFNVGDPMNTFGDQGLSISVTNALDSENIGTVTWRVENNSGSSITDFSAFSYLNSDIDFATNTFFNEHAEFIGNTDATSYEIDEPGYVFGDIYDNLMVGSLDNTNQVPSSAPEDVSFSLGFDLGTFEVGAWFEATVEISLLDIGGVEHSDADSNFSYFFNTTIDRSPVNVPEPGTLALLLLGLATLFGGRLKNKSSIQF